MLGLELQFEFNSQPNSISYTRLTSQSDSTSYIRLTSQPDSISYSRLTSQPDNIAYSGLTSQPVSISPSGTIVASTFRVGLLFFSSRLGLICRFPLQWGQGLGFT